MSDIRGGLVRTILSNAGSLAGTTIVTALLGFAFWTLAARLFPPEVVGYGSAAISAMILIGTIGTMGLETALIGEMAERPNQRGPIVAAALVASAAGSALLAITALLVANLADLMAGGLPVLQRADLVALFVLGVALTGATFVLDAAFIGALHGGVQLHRNVAFSVAKLVLLAVAGLSVRDWGSAGLLAAWTVGAAFSLTWVAVVLRARGVRLRHMPNAASVYRVLRSAAPHNWLNLALDGPHLVIPILATALVTATAGAAFFAAWTMASFLFILPFHLGTVLYATGSAEPDAVPRQLRFTLRTSMLIGLCGVPGMLVAGPWLLSLFGSTYRELGTAPLMIVAAAYPAVVIAAHYVAVCRIRRRTVLAAAVLTVGGGMEVGFAAVGALSGGLVGLAVGVVAGKWLQCALMVPAVLRTARTAATPVPISEEIHP